MNKIYFLRNLETELYADVQSGTMSNGNEIEQQTFDGASTQKWIFTHIGNDVYTIRSAQNNAYYLGIQNDSTADGANIVLRTGTVTSGMKWRIEEGNEGYKIVSYSDPTMVLATYSSNATVGQKLILGDYVDNDSYRDEWEFYDTVFSYVNYYDSTFTGSNSYLQAYISDANSFANTVFRRYFGVGFRMDGAAQQNNTIIPDSECSQGVNLPCTDACGSPHHKDGLAISNTLYNAPRENNHVYVLWTHRPKGTYCDMDDNVHSEVSWIAVVYGKRPVIHFMHISGNDTLQQQACMTLNLVHETAHTFGMYDMYDNAGHDTIGAYNCIMERFEADKAYAYYQNVKDGYAEAFCSSCLEKMQELVPKKLHHHN